MPRYLHFLLILLESCLLYSMWQCEFGGGGLSGCSDCECLNNYVEGQLKPDHTRYCNVKVWWQEIIRFGSDDPGGYGHNDYTYGLVSKPNGHHDLDSYQKWVNTDDKRQRTKHVLDLVQYEFCQKDLLEYSELTPIYMKDNFTYKVRVVEKKAFYNNKRQEIIYFQLGATCKSISGNDGEFRFQFNIVRSVVVKSSIHNFNYPCNISWTSEKLELSDLEKDEPEGCKRTEFYYD